MSAVETLPRGRSTKLVLGWRDVERGVETICSSLRYHTIDAVVPIARGGLLPAVMIAYRMGVGIGGILFPAAGVAGASLLCNAKPSRYAENVEIFDRLLLVDDIIDSGATIEAAQKLLNGASIAALCAHEGRESLWDACGYVIEPDMWVVFPWAINDR